MILIERWLAGSRNFIVGRNLYGTYGTDDGLKKLFAMGETPVARKRLECELEAIHKAGKRPALKTAVTEVQAMPKGTDEVLIAIEKDWNPKYQEMNMLRHQLDAFGDDNSVEAAAACKPICEAILNLEQECIALWKKRDHYEQHGQLPEVKEELFKIPEDPVELAKLIHNLKRYVRRNKQKAETNPDNALYPVLVKKYQSQLDQILNMKNLSP